MGKPHEAKTDVKIPKSAAANTKRKERSIGGE
jgi:hypothetical protein